VEQKRTHRRGLLTHGVTRSARTGLRVSTRGTSTPNLGMKVQIASNRLRKRLATLRLAGALTTNSLDYKFLIISPAMLYPGSDQGHGLLLNYRHYY